jgi:hypothetical protein
MIARNCTIEDLQAALELVNVKYKGNIKFKHIDLTGRRVSFTLTVQQTSIGKGKNKVSAPGVRRGFQGKRIAAACWHVHGDFFDALLKVNPSAGIYSSGSLANPLSGKWITAEGGNWQDWQVGNRMQPRNISQMCDCGSLRPTRESGGMEIFEIGRAMISKCPFYIFDPAHYKQDGTCKCFDQEEQARLKVERAERRAKVLGL